MEYSEESIILGCGRVLVMDDEAAVREMIGKMLHCLGYEADYASNGSEAVRLYQKLRESGQAYDAVIMDLTIPGDMGGKETLKRLMEIDPGVKAIISSGYADNPVLVDYDQYGFCGVIPKPYEIRGLNKVLSEVIVNRN
jgi:CheY-like chemotaxis protein